MAVGCYKCTLFLCIIIIVDLYVRCITCTCVYLARCSVYILLLNFPNSIDEGPEAPAHITVHLHLLQWTVVDTVEIGRLEEEQSAN